MAELSSWRYGFAVAQLVTLATGLRGRSWERRRLNMVYE